MRRTLNRIKEAWATWKLWRHNVKYLCEVARDTAAYFTSRGEKLDPLDREDQYADAILLELGADAERLLNPAHTLSGADPFGRFARSLHGDSDA